MTLCAHLCYSVLMPSDRKAIALRLDDELRERIESLAASEYRTVANMAEVLVRAGLDQRYQPLNTPRQDLP